MVGARPSLPGRVEGDPPAAAGAPRHQGRQRLHSARAREFRSGCAGTTLHPMFGAARADRLRVRAGVAGEPHRRRCRSAGNGNTTISRRACSRRSRTAATATCGRRASSTGAATCTASPRCSSATCPTKRMVHQPERATGWTSERYDAAKALILTLRDHHDRDAPQLHPHPELIDATGARLRESDLALSLASGWTLARDVSVAPAGASPLTPMTRLAPPIRVFVSPHDRWSPSRQAATVAPREMPALLITKRNDVVRARAQGSGTRYAAAAGVVLLALGAAGASAMFPDIARAVTEGAQTWFNSVMAKSESSPSAATAGKAQREEAPAKAEAQVGQAPSEPTTAPAEEPSASAAASKAVPDTESAGTDGRIAEPTATRNAEAGALTAAPNRRVDGAPLPSISRTNPKSMPSVNEAARASGKRAPANSTAMSAARSPKPSTMAKLSSAPSASASRFALSSPRPLPATSVNAARPSGSAGRVEPSPAPIQVAQAAAPASPATSIEPPTSPAQPLAAPPITSPNPATSPEAKPSSAQGTTAASTIASSPPVRRERPQSATDDLRAGIGFLSQLFQLAKRTPAPIEDRRLQAAPPADQAPSAQPLPPSRQERLAPTIRGECAAGAIDHLARWFRRAGQPSPSSPSSPPPAAAGEWRPPHRRQPMRSRRRPRPPWSSAPRVMPPAPAVPVAPAEDASSCRAGEMGTRCGRGARSRRPFHGWRCRLRPKSPVCCGCRQCR